MCSKKVQSSIIDLKTRAKHFSPVNGRIVLVQNNVILSAAKNLRGIVQVHTCQVDPSLHSW
jgi:hypothetical protein